MKPDLQLQSSAINNARETPELNGSSASFLALVISLSLFVVGCCVAIFWLLKYHQPTDEERVRRNVELTSTRGQDIESAPGTLGGKIGKIFGLNKRGEWVRAAGEEELDGSPVWRGRELVDPGPVPRPVSYSSEDSAHSRSSSGSTVQLSVPSSPTTPIAGQMFNPFTGRMMASPEPSIMMSRMSTDSLYDKRLSRDRSMSAEIVHPPHDRHFSVQSFDPDEGHISMQKWDNGTKFQEAIQ